MLVNRSLLLCHLLLHYFLIAFRSLLLKHGLESPSEQRQGRMGIPWPQILGRGTYTERTQLSKSEAAGQQLLLRKKLRSWVLLSPGLQWRLLGPGLQWRPLQQLLPPSSVSVFPL